MSGAGMTRARAPLKASSEVKASPHVACKIDVTLNGPHVLDVDHKSGIAGVSTTNKLVAQDRSKLSVYAFITSKWMRYPAGDHTRLHVFPLNPVTGKATVVLHTALEVPPNALLHLTLVAEEKDERKLRLVDAELGRALVELSSLAGGGGGGAGGYNACTAKLFSVYDSQWNMGEFQVSVHPDSALKQKGFGFPVLKGVIPRADPREKRIIAEKWIDESHKALWSMYQSNVYFPNGELYYPEREDDSVPTPDGPVPFLFYLYHASRFHPEDSTEFARAIIRMGCLRCGITVSEMLDLDTSNPLLTHVLCYALNSFPLALGYCTDIRGSSFSLPVAADSISHAPGMCVEFSTLVTVAERALRAGKGKECAKMQARLQGFRVCTALCTSRAGDVAISSTDVVSRHLTALLIPTKAFTVLASTDSAATMTASSGKSRFECYMLDTLEVVDPSCRASPGTRSPHESYVMRDKLPHSMSASVAFDSKTPGSKPGPNAFYRSVMKLFSVNDGEVLELACLGRSGYEWKIGIEMQDFVCKGLSADIHRFLCREPLKPSSPKLLAFESDFQETLHLTNLFQNTHSSLYLTDAAVERFVANVRELDANVGWKLGFYVMRTAKDVSQLQKSIDEATKEVPALARQYPESGIVSASAEILDVVNVTGDAVSACVLLQYSVNTSSKQASSKPSG